MVTLVALTIEFVAKVGLQEEHCLAIGWEYLLAWGLGLYWLMISLKVGDYNLVDSRLKNRICFFNIMCLVFMVVCWLRYIGMV